MPDWCLNKITIDGDQNCINKLRNMISEFLVASKKGDVLGFMEYLIGLGDIPSDYEVQGWYDYNIDWFGTKWDIVLSKLKLSLEGENILIEANTAWSPVIPFLSKLCVKYNVTAKIDYFEPASDYGGRANTYINGVVDNNEVDFIEAAYLYNKDLFWEEMEYYMGDEANVNFEDYLEGLSFIDNEARNEIELIWNVKKYNL